MAYSTRRLSRSENLSFSEGVFSPSAEAIIYILSNATPQDFLSGLMNAFTSAPLSLTQRQIDDFLATLKAAGIPNAAVAQRAVADETVRHCVRCHHSYLEKHNGRAACLILHDIPQPHPGPHIDLPVVFFYPCCSLTTNGDESSITPYHFLGRHTTLEKGVAYNSTNIRECHLGCPNYRPPSSASLDDMSSPATSRCSTPTGTAPDFDMEYVSLHEASGTSTESSPTDSASDEDNGIY